MHKIHFVGLPRSLKKKTVFIRTDFNEPVRNGAFADSFRIRSIVPTIRELKQRGARVIIGAHLEHNNKPVSFKPYVADLERLLRMKLVFVDEPQRAHTEHAFEQGTVFLENLRKHPGEETNSRAFAKQLASLADIYVNEAFSVCHRKHASIVGVPQFLPSYPGLLLKREVERLSEALHPQHPFLFIVGGVKFKTKFALFKQILPKADAVFVGGALANTFLASCGISIGQSAFEHDAIPEIKKHFLESKKILLPFDAVFGKNKPARSIFEVKEHEKIQDIGTKTVLMVSELARLSKYVLWNGPLGDTAQGFDASTKALLQSLAKLKKGTKVIVGGGDTAEVLGDMRLHQHFYHVSTGGGAMLDFLADGTLVGIEALVKSQKKL